MKERIKTGLKIGISLSLFIFVVYSVEPSKIWSILKGADPLFLIPAIFLIAIVGKIVSAKKLQILLEAKGEEISFLTVLRYYYVGTYFNIFLPTTVGGDVIKAYKISGRIKNEEEAYSSVFMERFAGLIAVITLASASSLLYFETIPTAAIIAIFGVFIPAILLIFIFIIKKSAVERLKPVFSPLLRIFEFFSLREKLRRIYKSVNEYKRHRKGTSYALGLSFLFHTILILSNFLFSRAVGMQVSLHYFFVFIPVCAVLLFLPISIKGFGVREVLYVYFFTKVGSSSSQAFSMSFLFQISVIIGAALGGIIYALSEIDY